MADFLILEEDKNKEFSDNNSNSLIIKKSFFESINEKINSFKKIKTKNKVIFYRLLSTMMNAWVPLMKSISILEKQEKDLFFKSILLYFYNNVKEWKTLSESMLKYPSSFWEAEIWIIKSWEKTGQLNYVLTDLANQIEKIDSIAWKIKSAMMYPLFVILVVVWVIAVMMVAVVPKLLELFEWWEWLPWSTLALMAISDAFVNYWLIMVIFSFISFVLFKIWVKTPSWLYLFDFFKLKIPVFWDINKKLILSKFSRTFSWLVSWWVSIVESLKITAEAVWNDVYKQRIILLGEDISWGIKMWESLDWDKLFPTMMVQMIQVWEETAKLDKTIIKIAEFYDEQVDNTIWVINKLLEPFIIVTLAWIVWFIAVWIMQPIMWLADTVGNM